MHRPFDDYTSGNKQRLLKLELLPLMCIYDLTDIMFFIKSVKFPTDKLNIFNFVEFISGPTRSVGYKLRPKTASTNSTMNSVYPDCGIHY